jgi:hypothetical protein
MMQIIWNIESLQIAEQNGRWSGSEERERGLAGGMDIEGSQKRRRIWFRP